MLTNASRLDSSIVVLRRSGRLPEDIEKQADLSNGPGYSGIFGLYGRGMQEYLIIPYLRGDIMQ